MKASIIKLISLFLVFVMLFTALISCASNNNGESGSDSESDSSADVGEGESEYVFDENGTVPIFTGGNYVGKIIRSDSASTLEKDVYSQIKELIKKHTGVNPSIDTDFTAAGAEKYNGPAILIGETKYAESKQAYRSLGLGQSVAKVMGNKFVLSFTNNESATKLIEAFKASLSKRATKPELIIDAKWNSSIKGSIDYEGSQSFNEDGVVNRISAAPAVFGTEYDSGQYGRTYIKKNVTTKTAFDKFCVDLESLGCKRYTANTIGDNMFATYVTQTQIIHLMYFPSKSEIRTAIDPRGNGYNPDTDQPFFTLPKLQSENKYTKKNDDPKMIVVDIANADWPGGLCIIYKLADGRFFIVDAGMGGATHDKRTDVGSSSEWIYKTLAKYAEDKNNIQVAAWLITHPHSDHAGGLYDMAVGWHAKYGKSKTDVSWIKDKIKIDTVIYNQPAKMVHGRASWMDTILKAFNVKNIVKAHPGQVFYIADLTLTIYGSQDIMIEDTKNMTGDRCDLNEQSVSARVEFNGKSILVLGDSDVFPNRQLAPIYKNTLKSDILQLAHHGYGDTGDASVNSYCDPSIAIWAERNSNPWNKWPIKENKSIKDISPKNRYQPKYKQNLVFDKNWKVSHVGV